jgi:hypothetical protein
MSRFEITDGPFGPEIGLLRLEDEIGDSDDHETEEEDRPTRAPSPRDFPIRLPGYRELETRFLREEE